MNTIAQYDARLRELQEMANVHYNEHQLVQAEKLEIESRKRMIKLNFFVSLVDDKEAFDERCFMEMGAVRKKFPVCFCRHHDSIKFASEEKFRSLYMGLGIKTEDLLFPVRHGAPQPIYDLIWKKSGCYTIDDCLETLRTYLKQLPRNMPG